MNPVVWQEVMEYLRLYWRRSPYEQRVATPSVRMIPSSRLYSLAFKVQRKFPMAIAMGATKVLGTKSMKSKMS